MFPGRGQRPLPVCPKDTTRWEGEGESMCQEIQRICHSCDSGLFQKQANIDDSLDGSHPRSFLERTELQESGVPPPPPEGLFSPAGWPAVRQAGRGYSLWVPPSLSPCRASSDSFIQMQKAFQSSQSLWLAWSFSLLNGDLPHPLHPHPHPPIPHPPSPHPISPP